jgi:hypothetical protein
MPSPSQGGQIGEKVAELVDKFRFLDATGDSVMLKKKTLLITLFGTGAASAPAFADVGLFFNNGQGYYGQNYYGLYPFSTLPYYDPYNQPYYSGAVANCVEIRSDAVTGDMKIPCQAARSIG